MSALHLARERLRSEPLARRIGRVRQTRGMAIDAEGPEAMVGELCRISLAERDPAQGGRASLLAEVVGFKPGCVTLMPYGSPQGIAPGSEVEALGVESDLAVGDALLGRVIDGFCHPLDGHAPPVLLRRRPLRARPQNPMQRPPVSQILETGVRTIDALLTLGKGQRVGIFAGSGVGKSTLLGMLAQHVKADVNVIALIGERGREVREFVERRLGTEGRKRSVVVVATADQPALSRMRAVHAALAIAEYFRERGQHVLLTMDSITRYAMARREVGLAAGEPPTARGYTPSVFSELPGLCERCGTHASGGSITALMTVLVEGDDLNEPIADCLRATLDGHIVLSRQLAHQGLYPAIDPLRSVSRLMAELVQPAEHQLAMAVQQMLALLERNQQMLEMGAYERGSNPELDAAFALQGRLRAWMGQSAGGVARSEGLASLADILRQAPAKVGAR